MKTRLGLVGFLLLAAATFAATQEEIWKIYQQGDAVKAAAMGLAEIKTAPDNIDLRQVTGRALVDSQQFAEALPHLQRVVELDANKSWQSAWALGYAGYAHFGLGDSMKAREVFEASLKLKATRNVVSFVQRAQMLLGLAAVYTNWMVVETEHFRFHFSVEARTINTNSFVASRESAFARINQFFGAKMPKKIDFFVWRSSEDAERAGLGTLGFARPEMCLVHSAGNQTRGHEMTHVICRQAVKPAKTSGLINEGIAVYFDQTGRDRLATARRAVREAKMESVSITDLWERLRAKSDSITYPVAAAFIERLHKKGGDEKLKQLAREQTLEAAKRIYGGELEAWIAEFEKELVAP